MIHTTLTFDAKDWARWADSAGIDKRGIAFVLNHPEAVTFKRTTPRTLEQFFRQIENIEDLQKEGELVRRLGAGTLDDVTIGTFMSFVRDDLTELIDPEDILGAQDYKTIDDQLEQVGKDKDGNKRLDRISTICTRLFIHISREEYSPDSRGQFNLCSFLKSEHIVRDLKVGLAMDISKEASEQVRDMLRSDPQVAKLLLGSM